MDKFQASLPAGLEEEDLLNLGIRARLRGEKLSLWFQKHERLIILFDGQTGKSLMEYSFSQCFVAPGAYLILDMYVPASMTGANIAGLTMHAPNYILSRYYQLMWGGQYFEKAKEFNSQHQRISPEILWELYSAVQFADHQDHPDEESIRNASLYFQAFNDLISGKLKDMRMVHVPLVLDSSQLPSMH